MIDEIFEEMIRNLDSKPRFVMDLCEEEPYAFQQIECVLADEKEKSLTGGYFIEDPSEEGWWRSVEQCTSGSYLGIHLSVGKTKLRIAESDGGDELDAIVIKHDGERSSHSDTHSGAFYGVERSRVILLPEGIMAMFYSHPEDEDLVVEALDLEVTNNKFGRTIQESKARMHVIDGLNEYQKDIFLNSELFNETFKLMNLAQNAYFAKNVKNCWIFETALSGR